MSRISLNETMERVLLQVRSGQPVIYIVSYEESRVLDFLVRLVSVLRAEDGNKHLYYWSEGTGLTRMDPPPAAAQTSGEGDRDGALRNWLAIPGMPALQGWDPSGNDRAEQALMAIRGAAPEPNPQLANSLTVFFDLHRRLMTQANDGSMVRQVRNVSNDLRRYYDYMMANYRQLGLAAPPYKTVIIVAPTAEGLSPELDRDLAIIDFPLPEQAELVQHVEQMIRSDVIQIATDPSPAERAAVAGDPKQPAPTADEYASRLKDLIAGGGRGLTLDGFRLGLNMLSVRGTTLSARNLRDILDKKAETINNRALYYTPQVDVQLAGLDTVKKWIQSRRDAARYQSVREKFNIPPLKGVMLCGASGAGKSMLARLIASEFNLALLRLDIGALFGPYVGEAEQRTRDALKLAEALAPVVLWLDEIEKAFSGIRGGGDSGVASRVFGTFLTWLAEKEDSVFVVATANDFSHLLDQTPEFGRKGRFDEIFWVDLPNRQSRQQIFDIYFRKWFNTRESDALPFRPEDVDDFVRTLPQLGVGQVVLPPLPDRGDAVTRLSQFLSDPIVSVNMTGAEIEYAVTECKHGFYYLTVSQQRDPRTVVELFFRTVQDAVKRAMYNPQSDNLEQLVALRRRARRLGWPFVGGDDAAGPQPGGAAGGGGPLPNLPWNLPGGPAGSTPPRH